MYLTQLEISHLRNIDGVSISPSPRINIIHGQNGSGKSSILESIYLLGLGRSFRTHQNRRIIQYGAESLSVFGVIEGKDGLQTKIGVEKSQKGFNRIKINGELAQGTADLIGALPLQLLTPDSYELINAGPKARRRFFDWGVFHVKHAFLEHWKRATRALNQRNSALRSKQSKAFIELWDKELISTSKELDILRKEFFEEFHPLFQSVMQRILGLSDICIDYYPGWNQQTALEDVLYNAYARDLELGFTQYGFHRADIRIKRGNIPVQDVLSRGQQKLLVYSLSLAQGILLKERLNKPCTYLIDDMLAELDKDKINLVAELLNSLKSQVFLTGVNANEFQGVFQADDAEWFHVEQGAIRPGMPKKNLLVANER